jgi:N6-adenosine-specific RNA methylase IME4
LKGSKSEMERRFHPVANIFPLLQGEEFDGLVESIRTKGLLNPIWLHPDGSVIDGRNRYNACPIAGVERRYQTWDGKGSLTDFVFAQNFDRRHLNATMRALAAKRAEPWYAKEAKERQLATLKKGKQHAPVTQKVGERKKHEGEAADKAAKVAKSNRQYVADLKRIEKEAPEIYAQIEAGEIELTPAKRQVREQKREKRRKENAELVKVAKTPEEIKAKFATIVIDPPWAVSDEGDVNQFGRANPDYHTMPFADILKLPVADKADVDCHLYLWITNRSLPKGFELIEAWGFRYITCLTWCKPSFGIGNYYRGSTEQILFAVKGQQSLKRKDVGTWFLAERGKNDLGKDDHSAKPAEAFQLIESCSPGPYLEWFPGSKVRDGWTKLGVAN